MKWREQSWRVRNRVGLALAGLVVLLGTAQCGRSGPASSSKAAVLRVGVGGVPQSGLQQYLANLSVEGLIAPYEDGRLRPWLAESWETAPDRLSVTVHLRPTARFHDGTPVTASLIAQALRSTLPNLLGPVFQEDVSEIVALDDRRLQIRLRQPSQILIEALEIAIRKPGKPSVGTGAYLMSPDSPSEVRANSNYYLERPALARIAFQTYPTIRTAWAELLRGNLDMLYEVNMDALDSLQASRNVSVFSFLRHYQYVIMFGDSMPALKDSAVRRELNAALDRAAIVRQVLNGHGLPSVGPVPPRHWALSASAPRFDFDPALAKKLAARHLHFTCLVAADSVYERLALVVKQQLAEASVDMTVKEVTQDEILQAGQERKFEALLIEVVSGPSMFRPFRHFYSKTPFEMKPAGNAIIDAALDRIRRAPSDEEYRLGVADFQRAIVNDPPEVFLIWAERARAVNHRFEVPTPDDGRDIINTARLWRPATAQQLASRN
jgi:peptide/nickel transport system substrate-binding protein